MKFYNIYLKVFDMTNIQQKEYTHIYDVYFETIRLFEQ
jgi:hypothetical protein